MAVETGLDAKRIQELDKEHSSASSRTCFCAERQEARRGADRSPRLDALRDEPAFRELG